MNSYLQDYLGCWKKFAVFTGRASVREYWTFTLIDSAIEFGLLLPNFMQTMHAAVHHLPAPHSGYAYVLGLLCDLYGFASFLPSIAVMVRRYHDTGRSGWWYWINLLPVVGWIVSVCFLLRHGDDGPNRYGNAGFECMD